MTKITPEISEALSRVHTGMPVANPADIIKAELATFTPQGTLALTLEGQKACHWPHHQEFGSDFVKTTKPALDKKPTDSNIIPSIQYYKNMGLPAPVSIILATSDYIRELSNAVGLHKNLGTHLGFLKALRPAFPKGVDITGKILKAFKGNQEPLDPSPGPALEPA